MRHLCECSRPLITESEPDGFDACKRCRGAITEEAALSLPELPVPYGKTHPADLAGFKRWADEAITDARTRRYRV
jgi:hypothetical protein